MDRRQALCAFGASVTTAVAGCSSLSGSSCPPRVEPQWLIEGESWSPPVKRDNRLLVSENFGVTGTDRLSRIVCTNTDGQEQWIYNVERGGAGVPLVHDGQVYVGTGADLVYSFDFETGHRKWRYDADGKEKYGGGAWGQPVIVDSSVVVGISHSNRRDPDPANSDEYVHRVVALDTNDGSKDWAHAVEGMIWSGPVRVGESIVVATQQGRVYRLDATTGDRIWAVPLGSAVSVRPVADDGTVYAASEGGLIAAFDFESGEKDWRSQMSGNVTALADTDGLVLVGDDAGVVTALSKDTGESEWQCEIDAAVAALAVAGDAIWVLSQRGFARTLSTTGSETRKVRVAENRFDGACGWRPRYGRGSGITADESGVYVTGPWIGKFDSEE